MLIDKLYNMKTYYLNKTCYDSSIDYLKGLCIFFVVLTHCIPKLVQDWSLFCLWGGMAVPIFLIIQVFHAYKRENEILRFNFRKTWERVLKPFVIMQLLMLVISLVGGGNFEENIRNFVKSGGYGPGSYYVWIYFQFALLLSLLYKLCSKLRKIGLLVIFIGLSVSAEVICSFTLMPEYIYRLLCIRYLFLIYFGIILIREGLVMNKLNIALSIISGVAILFFCYTRINLQPVFYSSNWKVTHWPCYFYVGLFLLWLLRWSYDWMKEKHPRIKRLIERMGVYSYEIFLFQMLYFYYVSESKVFLDALIGPVVVRFVIMLASPFLCVFPVLWWKDKRLLVR